RRKLERSGERCIVPLWQRNGSGYVDCSRHGEYCLCGIDGFLFQQCMLESGEGDVAVSLGMDGRIAELAEDVDAAKADIREVTKLLLEESERKAQINILGMA